MWRGLILLNIIFVAYDDAPGLSFFYGWYGFVRRMHLDLCCGVSFVMGICGCYMGGCLVSGFTFESDIIPHVIGNPMDFIMMKTSGSGNVTDPSSEMSQIGLVTTITTGALCIVFRIEFSHHHAVAHHGSICREMHFSGYLLFMILWTMVDCIVPLSPTVHGIPEVFLA